MLDEAHATGVLGPGGAGACALFDLHGRVDVLMGTLGKALGSVGGFIAGSRDLIDYLARAARSFVFTTSLPAPAAAAALAALRILRAEPERVTALSANAEQLRRGLAEAGFDVLPGPTPIIPVRFGSERIAGEMARRLLARGVSVQAIGAPYVPAGTSRIRVIASAAHRPRISSARWPRFRRRPASSRQAAQTHDGLFVITRRRTGSETHSRRGQDEDRRAALTHALRW